MTAWSFGALCCFVGVLLPTGSAWCAASDVADAAMNGNRQAIRSLLQQKADVNAPEADGATALHWAVRQDDIETVDLLIEAGANVSAASRFGVTPLFLACLNGNPAIIQKLLDTGADVKSPFSQLGETPLMIASRTGNADAVKVLLDHGAPVNDREKSRGDTALMWAAAEGHAAVVQLLMQHGADVNARSNRAVAAAAKPGDRARGGPAPLDRAGQTECPVTGGPPQPEPIFGVPGPAVRTKATAGGCISTLILATRQNHAETVRLLLEAGADPNLTMADGTSALVVAIINAHYQIAAFLLEKGADPNIADGKGMAVLYAAVDMHNVITTDVPQAKGDDMDPLDLIQAILKHGANVNARLTAKLPYRGGTNPTWQSEVGATPFLRAAYSTDITVMRLLLAYGADPGITASDKTTPLMAAAGVG